MKMNRDRVSFLIAAIGLASTLVVAGPSSGPESAHYYVALNGQDGWTGKAAAPNQDRTDGPFASLERARDAIRRLKKAGELPPGGVGVTLRGGIYERDRVFTLSAEDSGREGAPVVYRAYPGESVQLVGGKVVRGFEPVTDPDVLDRWVEAARGKVLQANLKAQGITQFGSPAGGGLELFFQGRPMKLARWPNEGFAKIEKLVGGEPFLDVHQTAGDRVGKFTYGCDQAKRWEGEKDPWVQGYWFFDWRDERQRIGSIESGGNVIAIAPPYHGSGYRQGQPFYGFNLLAELDQAGEWYLDRATGILYFWPPGPVQEGPVIVSLQPALVIMTDVSHASLRGMIFEAVRGTAIILGGGTQNQIVGCTIRNTGSWGARLSGGLANGVVGCDIYQTGQGGIELNGGERRNLTPARLFAENNHLHDFGRWNRMYQPGINLVGVGNRASHNLIHNAPHDAIIFTGNDHLIEFNEIHSVCQESNDAGAICSGGDWSLRGTVIRHNYFHHLSGFEGRGCVGVYLDNMGCGTTIYGNLFYQVAQAVAIGGGRDNIVENNIFVSCHPAIALDARAMPWNKGPVDENLKRLLESMPYQQSPWRERYPALVNILADDPGIPKGNQIVRNVCQGGKWDEIAERARPYITIKDNLVRVMYGDEHPRFVDPANENFQLRDDSRAYELGFKKIPLEQIGLYRDDRRASWPVVQKIGPVR